MNKARIWPSSILILGLGAMSSLATLPPTSGTCPFQGPCSVATSDGQQLFQQTTRLLESRYGSQLDRNAMSQGVADAVRAELERSGKSTAMLPFLQMMYLPNQPERFLTACSTDLPSDQLWQAATRGLLKGVHDNRASLINPEEMSVFENIHALPMNGIGAVLCPDAGNGLIIQRPLTGHPAERAGIQAGDRIVAIDGESTQGMGLYTGMSRLRGLAGTQVELSVEHEGTVRDVTITREPLNPGPSVNAGWKDSQTGQIRVNYIDYTAGDQVSAALSAMEGAPNVVLDLRDLGGYDITSAQRIASCFVAPNTLVGRLESSTGQSNELRTLTPPQYGGSVTVLVNENTCGSAELLASCLQENGAHLEGSTTAGHVGGLTMVPMPDGSALQLPGETWYNASHEPIDGHGVQP